MPKLENKDSLRLNTRKVYKSDIALNNIKKALRCAYKEIEQMQSHHHRHAYKNQKTKSVEKK